MAYGYRRWNRYWRRGGWFNSGVRRAQTQGVRRFTISIPVEETFTLGVDNNALDSTSLYGVFPLMNSSLNDTRAEHRNCHCNLLLSDVFRTYCGLYDEVKINSVSMGLSVMSVPVGSGFKIYTMIDRHANVTDTLGYFALSSKINGSEVDSSVFTSLQRAKYYRYFKARDLGERTSFFDATYGTKTLPQYQSGGVQVASHDNIVNEDWYNNAVGTAFCPLIQFGLKFSSNAVQGASATVNLTVRYNLTFRNPKYDVSVAPARALSVSDMRKAVVEEVKEDAETEDVKMSDEKEDEMEEAPVLKKKKVVYEEEVLPDVEDEEDDEESQAPLTQPFKSPMKKAGKKVST